MSTTKRFSTTEECTTQSVVCIWLPRSTRTQKNLSLLVLAKNLFYRGVLCTAKGPNFDLCQTKLKIELENCHRRFKTYSRALWIGSQKSSIFSQIIMAPF